MPSIHAGHPGEGESFCAKLEARKVNLQDLVYLLISSCLINLRYRPVLVIPVRTFEILMSSLNNGNTTCGYIDGLFSECEHIDLAHSRKPFGIVIAKVSG